MTGVSSATHAWILCPHNLLKRFVYDYSQFTPITSLISINRLVLVTETVCFLWGPNWIFILLKFQSSTRFISGCCCHYYLFTYTIIFKLLLPEGRDGDVGKTSKKVMPFLPSPLLYKKWRFRALSKRRDVRRTGVEVRIEMLLVYVPRKGTCGHNPLLL